MIETAPLAIAPEQPLTTEIVAGQRLDADEHPNYAEPWSVQSSIAAFTDLCLDRGVVWTDLRYGGPKPAAGGGWRASELGYCRRKSYYSRIGAPRADTTTATKGKFSFGHMIEAVVVAALKADPRIEWLSDQESLYDEDLDLGCHADGIVRVIATGAIEAIEIKSMNGNAFKYAKSLPKPWHRLQIGTVIMLYRKVKGVPVRRGRVIYISKDNWQTEERGVSLTPALADEIVTEARALTELLEIGEPPRRLPRTFKVMKRGPDKGKTRTNRAYKCGYCDFAKFCYSEED